LWIVLGRGYLLNKNCGSYMYQNFKILIYLGLTIIILTGLCNCQNKNKVDNKAADTLSVEDVSTQSDSTKKSQITKQINDSRHNAITRAAASAGPAVVGITVIEIRRYIQRSPFYDDPFWRQLMPELFRDRVFEQPVQSLGSGFLISSDGYLVTNDHVVGDGDEIVITLPGGERHNANLVGTDKVSDISLLKIDGQNFPYLKLGDSDDLMIGEWVLALGNPFGLFELNDQPTVTVGVISALNRDWGRIPESNRVYMDMIQTDAAINHGNSGGPLVNSQGQVIGMNTFIYTGSRYQEGFVGIGFAIPINRIKEIVNEIKKQGSVNRDYWIGFKVQNVNPIIMRALGLKIKNGVIVTHIDQGSSADKAGLLPEDIIIKVEDHEVTDTNSILRILTDMDLQVGSVLKFTIIRDNKEKIIQMKLLEKRK
jgi:serine protease Do